MPDFPDGAYVKLRVTGECLQVVEQLLAYQRSGPPGALWVRELVGAGRKVWVYPDDVQVATVPEVVAWKMGVLA